jgi:hypothetical protein
MAGAKVYLVGIQQAPCFDGNVNGVWDVRYGRKRCDRRHLPRPSFCVIAQAILCWGWEGIELVCVQTFEYRCVYCTWRIISVVVKTNIELRTNDEVLARN